MATITSSGLASGLDINSILTKLMDAERAPTTKRLDNQEAQIQAKLTGIGTFKGAVSDFRAAVAGISSATKFQNLSATVSNGDLFSASATSAAQAGSYDIKVTKLAQAQKLATAKDANFTAISDVLGSGTLTFQFGTLAGGEFTANPAKTTKTVTIDPTNNTLAGVRDAINKADVGVSATLIKDGDQYRLSISATDAGAANSLKIGVTDTDGNSTDQTGLSMLAYNPTLADGVAGKNMVQTVAAQNAELTVDGLDITSASNSVVGVVPGVTLTLKSTSDTATTLNVAQDNSTATKAVEAFVAGYNKLMETHKSLTFFNAQTGQGGALIGNASVRSITSQIRNALTSAITGTTGTMRSLADAGISLQRDGTLKLDGGKLDTALKADPQAVAGLFSRVTRTTDPLISASSPGSASQPGIYPITVSQLGTQGRYTGSTASELTIGADNSTFKLKVNGVESGEITLTQKTYASSAALATELQSQINANSTLQTASASISVGYQSGAFTFTSNLYGSASKIEFTQASASFQTTFGISLGQSQTGQVDGQDVAGTIGSATATGSGRKLTGAGAAAGLNVEVLGGSTGTRGALAFSGGIAQKLDSLLGNFLSQTGPLSNETNNLNQRIETIGTQRTALTKRLDSLEARYRTQFLNMDQIIGQLNTTSAFLTQQMTALNNSNK
ncbi:MAG: flagellar hook protein [Candidatus Competibacteraceae bacterium]|nr:MAG: flagellar hook protein [Candidatus Competibacteraceae bacterium]